MFLSVDRRAGSAGRGSREMVSRVKETRPARNPCLTGQWEGDGSGQIESGGFKMSRVGSGRVGSRQEIFISHGSGRVEPTVVKISRVGSGLV